MSGHQSSFRLIGQQIQRAMDPDSRYPRYRERSRSEIQTFLSRLAATGVDIGGGPYPVRRSVAFRGPEHPIEGPWRNGMLLGEPRPWPVVYQEPNTDNQETAVTTSPHHQSSSTRHHREHTLSRQWAQWRDPQAQYGRQRRYENETPAARSWRQYDQRERQRAAYRMAPATTTTTNASSYDSENEWGYNMTRPRGRVTYNSHVQWGDDHDYVPTDEHARAESEEEQEPVRRGVNHSTPDFLLSAHPELDPNYDQEYVTMSGRRIPSSRERDARRKDGPPRDYLERIYMHEPGFNGRLVVANA